MAPVQKGLALALLAASLALPAFAQNATDDENALTAELAKEVQNPVAHLVQLPIQNNWDFGIGPANAMRYTANVQPVVPFPLGDDWHLITRTVVPFVYAESPAVGGDNKAGLGDLAQSFLFTPDAPLPGGWIWGAGPTFVWPTATDRALGAGEYGAGPTLVLLRQNSGWTYGALLNHIWSYAGWGGRVVNATLFQPFVSYTTRTYTTFSFNTEPAYDWRYHQRIVPLNFGVSQLLQRGKRPISAGLGFAYYVDRPGGGPDWGLNFTVKFLFPK